MPPLDERIRRAQLEREAQERRAARRSHSGAEDTIPPPQDQRVPTLPEFPPPYIDRSPDGGYPQGPPLATTHGAFKNVWGIALVIIAAIGAGWAARSAIVNATGTAEKLDLIRKDVNDLKIVQSVNQVSNEKTMTGMQNDVAELKAAMRVANNPEPLMAKRPSQEKQHR